MCRAGNTRNEHKGDCAGDSWRRYLLTTRLAQSENTLKTSARLYVGGKKGDSFCGFPVGNYSLLLPHEHVPLWDSSPR